MKTSIKILAVSVAAAAAGLQGCATSGSQAGLQGRLDTMQQEVESMQQQVRTKDQRIMELEAKPTPTAPNPKSDLLPPSAKAGECYARVWVPATYRNYTKDLLAKEASERVEIIPARYEWAEERVLVSEASSRMEEVPAVYGTESEVVLVSEASRTWRTNLADGVPVSPDLLAAAKAHGVNLDEATPGMCFHEHYRPAKFEPVQQEVLVSEASASVSVQDAKYRWVEKEVLVSEASSQLVEIPAIYGWEEEQVVDKPAHTIWQKGTGPIQRIDEATGEIMCLVEVPATYKTIRKRVLQSPATTKRMEIPAKYKTVKVRELVQGPTEIKNEIPAKYTTVTGSRKVADASFVWHEVHNLQEPKTTRTGKKICLTEQPAQYKTVTRRVVKSPATVRSVEIPAEYKTVKVRKLVSAAEEKRIPIPAEYKAVTYTELDKEGYMDWRSILCKTNMTDTRISQIQSALKQAGYNPGPIDGDIGEQTMSAVNAFQRDKGLPVDRYLNLETLKALGVSAR